MLEAGATYRTGWDEGDGAAHNIQIRDDEVVNGLETEVTAEPKADQILEFTTREEMAAYVCHPHQNTMSG